MDKVRIRVGNLTMTNHPIHLHGHEFLITGTDGGPTPKSSRQYEVTADIAVGRCGRWIFWPTRKVTGPSTATRATTR